jgi:SAM-dependent methyltransferase
MTGVVWHDIECGSYRADLPLWLGLAAQRRGPVLDVGAGTGRVTLPLARAGHEVVALDRDPALLAELRRRADGLPVSTVTADARSFSLDRGSARFALVLVPMQTIQLLGGPDGRGAFLRCAQRHLTPDGVVAIAIAVRFDEFELSDGEPGPLPDIQERDGVVYSSLPTAVRREGAVVVLERRREQVDPRGSRDVTADRIALDVVSVRQLAREGAAAGLRSLGVHAIAPTAEHVGSQVVILGG